jgi:hypothetical protein
MVTLIACSPKSLPREKWVAAARHAVEINPTNHPRLERLVRVMPDFKITPERLSVVTQKYWGIKGVRLTVGFLDTPPADLRTHILLHMNAWAKTANVQFVAASTDPQVRIARINDPEKGGYWSYIGTDIHSIPKGEPTMNLQDFTMQTPESEFHRVVRHETGHTLGFPHEHMRRELVAKIDPDKAIEFYGRTQGWSEAEVRQQVLTPIEDSSIRGTANADPKSIMCYQIPGSVTKSGQPIIGGLDIDASDFAFSALIYPKPRAKTPVKPKRTPSAPRAKHTKHSKSTRGAAHRKAARKGK